jgi:hypothetical protein
VNGGGIDELVFDIRPPSANATPGHTLISGLYLHGAAWRGNLVEMTAHEQNAQLPPLSVALSTTIPDREGMYLCPVFRTQARADDGERGFVVEIALPVGEVGAQHWVARGVAALLEL